jgi:Cu(I)/Ag(I) efflux system membrane fusion protein
MNPEVANEGSDFSQPTDIETSEAFLQSLEGVLLSYLELKDALVASAPESAAEKAGAMLEILPEAGDNRAAGERRTLLNFEKYLNRISQATDLKTQRAQFRLLSEALIGVARPLGTKDTPLYLQFCPMANDNKGAYWISRDSSIRNPYYGDAMLTCGEVRATWPDD